MSLVISTNLALNATGITADHPVVGYRNIVTASGLSADFANADFPVVNLANPATHLKWKSTSTASQRVYALIDGTTEVDYVAIARHNFGSAQIPVSVEALVSGSLNTIAGPVLLPPDDGPVIIQFSRMTTPEVVLFLGAGTSAPRAAVVYVGKLLTLERRIWVGHTPIPHGRRTAIQNGRSESGEFLGRIQLGGWRESTIPFSLISPEWYREKGDNFLDALAITPFFFGWRPGTYPYEVGYCWSLDDPMPAPTGPSNRIAFDMKVGGIV